MHKIHLPFLDKEINSEEIVKKLDNFTRELKCLGSKDLTVPELDRFHNRYIGIVKRIYYGRTKWTSQECKEVDKALNEFVERFSNRGFIYSEDNLNQSTFKTYLDDFMTAFLSLDISTLGPVAIAEYTTCFEEMGRTIKSLSPSKSSQLLRVQYELYSKDFYQKLSNRRNKRIQSQGSSKDFAFVNETLPNSTANSNVSGMSGYTNPSVPNYPNAKAEFSIFDTFLQFFYENNKTFSKNTQHSSATYFRRNRQRVDSAEEVTIENDSESVNNEEKNDKKSNGRHPKYEKMSYSCFNKSEFSSAEAEPSKTKEIRTRNEDKMLSGNDAFEDDNSHENNSLQEMNQGGLNSEQIVSSGSNQEEAEHIAPETILEDFMTTFNSLDINEVDDDVLEEYINRFQEIGRSITSLHPSESGAWLKTKYQLYRRHFWLIISKRASLENA